MNGDNPPVLLIPTVVPLPRIKSGLNHKLFVTSQVLSDPLNKYRGNMSKLGMCTFTPFLDDYRNNFLGGTSMACFCAFSLNDIGYKLSLCLLTNSKNFQKQSRAY